MIAYPYRIGDTGFPELVSGPESARDAFLAYLDEAPGERPYRPLEGVDAWGTIFANFTPLRAAQLAQQIRAGVSRDLPSVQLLDVSVEPMQGLPGHRVVLQYRFRGERNQLDVEFGNGG